MFDIGAGELLVIGVVALVVIGPKELPGVLRQVGKATAKMRQMAGEFRSQFDEAMREAELEDAKKQLNSIKDSVVNIDPLAEVRNEIHSTSAMLETPLIPPEPAKLVSLDTKALPSAPANDVAPLPVVKPRRKAAPKPDQDAGATPSKPKLIAGKADKADSAKPVKTASLKASSRKS